MLPVHTGSLHLHNTCCLSNNAIQRLTAHCRTCIRSPIRCLKIVKNINYKFSAFIKLKDALSIEEIMLILHDNRCRVYLDGFIMPFVLSVSLHDKSTSLRSTNEIRINALTSAYDAMYDAIFYAFGPIASISKLHRGNVHIRFWYKSSYKSACSRGHIIINGVGDLIAYSISSIDVNFGVNMDTGRGDKAITVNVLH